MRLSDLGYCVLETSDSGVADSVVVCVCVSVCLCVFVCVVVCVLERAPACISGANEVFVYWRLCRQQDRSRTHSSSGVGV